MPTTDQQREGQSAEGESGGHEDLPMSGTLTSFVEQACSLTSADGAAIAVRDAQGILCQASTGNAPALGSRLDPNSSFTRECFESGQIVVCQDAENDSRIQPAHARSLHLRSAVAIPIQRQGSILGVVEVFSSRPSAFDPTHIADLRRIAESLAPVLAPGATESQEPIRDSPPLLAVLPEAGSAAGEQPSAGPSVVVMTSEQPVDCSAAPTGTQADFSVVRPSTDQETSGKKKRNSARWIGAVGAVLCCFLISLFLLRFFAPPPNRDLKTSPAARKASVSSPTAHPPAKRSTDGGGTQHAVDAEGFKEPGPSHPVEVPPGSAPKGKKEEISGGGSLPKLPASPVELASKRSTDSSAPPGVLSPSPKPTGSEGHTESISSRQQVLVLEGAPPGANILVDNQLAASVDSSGRARISTLPPGQHHVRLTISGYQDYEQSFDLRTGQTFTVVARLEPLNAPVLAALAKTSNLTVPVNPPVLSAPAKTSSLTPPATIPPAPRPREIATLECELIRSFAAHSGWVTSIAFSADGQRLASGGWDETVKFWEVPSGEKLSTVEGKIKRVEAVAFSRDGRWLAAENSNYAVTLWDATTGQAIRTLSGSPPSGPGNNWIYSIAFSPDGRWLAAGVDNKTIRVWDVTNGRPMRDLTGSPRAVIYIAFSPDGRWLASGGDDKTIEIWDVISGREIRTLSGHKKEVYAVAFSPDGHWLASASKDKSVKLWDAATGREVRTLSGHRGWVTSVAFSPDGRWLASGSWDNTIKIWNVETGREVQTLSGQNHHVYAVAFDPGGHWLASGREDGKIELWKLERTVKRAEVDNTGNH